MVMKTNKMRCCKCGTINNRKRKVCRSCGAPLSMRRKWYFYVASAVCIVVISICYFTEKNKSEALLTTSVFSAPSALPDTTELLIDQQYDQERDNEFVSDNTSDSEYSVYSNFEIRDGIKFGMTKDDIIAIEGIPDYDGTEEDRALLAYATTVSGLDTLLYYRLDHDGYLAQVLYIFAETHSNENLYIYDFDGIENLLSRKYGEQKIEYTWLDDFYKDDKSEWGFAIALGDMQMRTSRGYYIEGDKFFGTIEIIHTLSGDNFDIAHALIYNTLQGSILNYNDYGGI